VTPSRIGPAAGAFVLAVAVSASAGTLTLEARAGLGGISRPGRWTPVRVTIDNTGADISGVLVVAWGDAEIRRDVTIPSPSRKQIQVYLRTSNVESAVRVQLVVDGAELRAVEAPVRLAAHLKTTTLCVRAKGASDAAGDACDATVTSDMLPDAARGYDAFDRVIWSGAIPGLEARAGAAFRRWQALRELEDSGSLAGTSHVTRPLVPRGLPADSRFTVAVGAVLYVAALVAVGLVAGARRGSTAGAYAGIALIVSLGSTAALALGRAGPAKTVVVQHSTLLQQLPEGHGSAISMRAIAEFPAFDAFTLRIAADDAFIEPTRGSDKKEHAFDEHGEPILTGTFGLGSRQAFAVEGFTALQPLSLTADGARVRVTNRFGASLRGCRFAEEFSVREVGTLQPGQTAEAIQQGEGIRGPAVTCVLPHLPVVFSEASRLVEARGIVRVAAYTQPRRGAADPGEAQP
jgi:hypothetical protein